MIKGETERNDKGIISKFHRGIVYEQQQDFSNSIFKNVYKRAYDLVQKNVQIQLEDTYENEYRSTPNNLIAFVGRRGTGKSSAMLSFMQALQNNVNGENEYTIYDRPVNGRPVRFISIDEIDTSLLEKGEDIFEVILAKMLKVFLEDIDQQSDERLDYEKNKMYNSFAEIYKKHLNIKKINGKHYSSEAAMSDLLDLSRSVDIKNEFQKLIQKFIDIKTDKRFFGKHKAEETFLVIAIDDIDMNIDLGFEILEKIQRYLSVDHLLIFLTINREQMQKCCERHFVKMYQIPLGKLYSSEFSSAKELKEHVKNISEQYMEKALPSYSRIYMPSLKKKDYDRKYLTRIRMETADGKNDDYSIKQAAFMLAARKTMVRYDIKGIKKHFMEPETLREVSDYWIFRESMKDLNEESDNFLEDLDMNYRRNMDDLLFRYAEEKLSESDSEIFIRLSEIDLNRRGEEVLFSLRRSVFENTYSVSEDTQKIWDEFEGGYKKFGYSYGELMHCLYSFRQVMLFGDKLADAILAMYSLNMTKIFYRYKKNADPEKKENNYKMLKHVFGYSAAGSWGLDILPKVYKDKTGNKLYAGACKNISLMGKQLEISEETENLIRKDRVIRNGQPDEIKIAEAAESMKWQFILMLFVTFKENAEYKNNISNSKAGQIGEENLSNPKPQAAIKFNKGKVDYGILDFVNNIFCFEERLFEFIKMLYQVLNLYNGVHTEERDNSIEKVCNKLLEDKDGFYHKLHTWHQDNGGMVIPLYATDLYYNLLKRVIREQKMLHMIISRDEIFDFFYELLEKIENALKENDECYVEGIKFAEVFEKCPIISEIRNAKNQEDKKKDIFNNFIYELINENYVDDKFDPIKEVLNKIKN